MAKKGTKNVRKRRTRPMKAAALVVSAIQNLRETNGSTFKKIAGYISYTSNLPEKRVKRQVSVLENNYQISLSIIRHSSSITYV